MNRFFGRRESDVAKSTAGSLTSAKATAGTLSGSPQEAQRDSLPQRRLSSVSTEEAANINALLKAAQERGPDALVERRRNSHGEDGTVQSTKPVKPLSDWEEERMREEAEAKAQAAIELRRINERIAKKEQASGSSLCHPRQFVC